MKKKVAKLLETHTPAPGYCLHTYDAPEIASMAEPGQFITVRVSEASHPILRRPFSILSIEGDAVRILFKIKGEGTEILSRAKKGELVDIIGPIGTPFSIGEKPAVLVAGGIGMAPLFFLAKTLKTKGQKTAFLYGAKTAADILLPDEIGKISDEFIVATEDGSKGERGLITERASSYLTEERAVYSCGPEPMLLALRKILDSRGLSAQFSLENYMACGVGACQGCSIETTRGFLRVCVDGPVFSSRDIVTIPFSTGIGGDKA